MINSQPKSRTLFTIPATEKLEMVFDIEYGVKKLKMLTGHEIIVVPNSGATNIPYLNAMLTEAGPWIVAVPVHRELTEGEINRLVLS